LPSHLCYLLSVSFCLQLRLKCLEALLQLLQLIQAHPTATAAWKAATTGPQQQQLGSSSGSTTATAAAAGGSLAAAVSACLSGVTANDPSVAHKALAGQAAAVLEKL